jgi:hypothetical protein
MDEYSYVVKNMHVAIIDKYSFTIPWCHHPCTPNLLIIRSNKTKNKSQGDKYHHSVMLNTLHSDILRVLLNVLFCKSEPYY